MADVISRRSIVYDITFGTTSAKKGANDISTSLKNTEKNINNASEAIDKFSSKTISAAARLKQIKNELNNFKGTEQRFQSLTLEAAKLQDQIDKTNQRIRTLASSTRNIQALASAFQGLTGIFAAVQGAQALFGKESENVQKALVKLNASLALLQGVQAAVATITEQSAAKTVILANAQKLYTFVTNGATIAAKAFRTALLATGAGVVLAALGAIITYWKDIKEAIFGAKETLMEFDKATTENQINQLKNQAALLAAQNKKNYDQRKKIIEAEIGLINDGLKKEYEARSANSTELNENELKLLKELDDKETELAILAEERERELNKEKLLNNAATQAAITLQFQENTRNRLNAEISLLNAQERLELESAADTQEAKNEIYFRYLNKRRQLEKEFRDYLRKLDAQDILFDVTQRLSFEFEGITFEQEEVLREASEKIAKILTDQQEDFAIAPTVDMTDLDALGKQLLAIKNESVTVAEVITDSAQQISADFATIFGNLSQLAKEGSDAQLALSIANIFAANAEALANAIASAAKLQWPANIPAIISSVATISTMFAQVNALMGKAKAAQSSVNAVAFAEGEVDIHRPGEVRGKDSIPAVIMPGESVLTAEKTRLYKPLVEAIHDGSIDDLIRVNYIEPALAINALEQASNDSRQVDYSNKFYRQLLATGEGNLNTGRMVRILASIDRKVTPKKNLGR